MKNYLHCLYTRLTTKSTPQGRKQKAMKKKPAKLKIKFLPEKLLKQNHSSKEVTNSENKTWQYLTLRNARL